MKILTVDDDLLIQKIIHRELEPSGYQIISAMNGKEGLEKLSSVPDIDLMTLDVEMPVMDGFGVLSNMNNAEILSKLEPLRNANIPVILVTSNDTKKVRDKGFKLGAANFVVKPFSSGELLQAVNKILKPNDLFRELNVLVVDDSKILRKFIVSSIMELGVTIYEADDGTTALNLIKKLKGDIDLILTDLNMKRMNGNELCWKIRNTLKMRDMPIIFLSSNEDRNKILEIFKIGATDYLSKPFFKEELLARMFVHLERCKMSKYSTTTVSELKDLKRFKVSISAILSQDLRSPLHNMIDSSKKLLKKNDQHFKDTLNNITSLSQALLYKINDMYALLDKYSQKPSKISALKTNSRTILIAEAKKVDTMLLTNLLKDYQCNVKISDNAALTVMAVEQSFENDPFNIIFLDMDSALINAATTLLKIKQLIKENQTNFTPVIIAMSEHQSSAIFEKSITSSINEILPKPIKRSQLRKIMEKYLGNNNDEN
jgi:CheY-like chemotaxis protein